jgi:hypothetical protein
LRADSSFKKVLLLRHASPSGIHTGRREGILPGSGKSAMVQTAKVQQIG